MPENLTGEALSRSAYLALKDEQRLVRDGYEFLDEKRIMLATELLKQRDIYNESRQDLARRFNEAATALQRAIVRHGLDGVQVQPESKLDKAALQKTSRSYIGLAIMQCELLLEGNVTAATAVHPSPETRECAQRFTELLGLSAQMAAQSRNINILIREYSRTERRTRALENVILPELAQALAQAEGYLEMLDQEEVIRVRFRKGRSASGKWST